MTGLVVGGIVGSSMDGFWCEWVSDLAVTEDIGFPEPVSSEARHSRRQRRVGSEVNERLGLCT
jgi:hypothetical protein